ncbi:hypothetical protein DKX38_010513 [Salix brachista]|uniref:Uncharacterized protein n=1 Tax=Salix brachista TaxID=2182728 RepID=A0A5N5MDY1_9ROSI|nr:hypothetical protein DKX38_010513 [Salix brachista]
MLDDLSRKLINWVGGASQGMEVDQELVKPCSQTAVVEFAESVITPSSGNSESGGSLQGNVCDVDADSLLESGCLNIFDRDLQPCNPCSRKSGPNVEWFHATRSLLLADPKLEFLLYSRFHFCATTVDSEVNRITLGKGEHCNAITVYKGKVQQLAQWFGQVLGERSSAEFGRGCELPDAKKLLSILAL